MELVGGLALMSIFEELEKKTWYLDGKEVPYVEYRDHYKAAGIPLETPIDGWTDEQVDEILLEQYKIKAALKDDTLENCRTDICNLIKIDDKGGKSIYPEHDQVAEILANYFDFARIGHENKSPLLIKENRCYTESGIDVILRLISKSLPKSNQNFRREVIRHLGDLNLCTSSDFDRLARILNCKNMYLDRTVMREYVNDDYKSRLQIESDYRPELGRSTLVELGIHAAIPEHAELFLQFMSSILLTDSVKLGKFLINIGDGRRGKSTYLLAIRNMFGKEKFGDLELTEIENKRFDVATLEGKWGNICTDMTGGKLLQTTKIKKLVFQEPINVENKGQTPHTMIFKGRLVFSTNELPELDTFSESFLNRLILIPWQGKKHELNEEYQKLLETPEEKSRILNTLLHYAKIVEKNGGIQFEQSHDELIELWRLNSNLTTQFIETRCSDLDEPVPTGYEVIVKPTLQVLYKEYRKYCKEKGKPSHSIETFDKRVEAMNYTKGKRKDGRIWIDLQLYITPTTKITD